MRYEPLEVRFWRKVDKSGECWVWTGHRNVDGYGMIGLERKGTDRVHRVSWRLHFGPIPEGLSVLHRCDHPACVRPDHLFLGTQVDNIADMDAKGRRRFAPTTKGSAHQWAKLTEADIPVIRRLAAEGMSNTQIGKRYGVHRLTIHLILNGKNWRHVISPD